MELPLLLIVVGIVLAVLTVGIAFKIGIACLLVGLLLLILPYLRRA